MADIANRYPENVAGKYYVDNQCIDCDLCRETAPENFTRNEDGGYSYVAVFYHKKRLYQLEGRAFVAGGQAEVDAMRFQQSLDFT